MRSSDYLSGTEYALFQDKAWFFYTGTGYQDIDTKITGNFAMAVRPGDVAAVPEPKTYALMLMGIGALMLAARRRTR